MRKFLRKILDSPIQTGLMALVILTIVILILDLSLRPTPDGFLTNILIEGHGLLMDVALFGVMLLWLEKKREHKRTAEEYRNQLDDFRFWGEPEGVMRKVGIIRRILAMSEQLPSLEGMILRGADLRGLDLSGKDFSKVDLSDAKLAGANLSNANFYLTDLHNATFADPSIDREDILIDLGGEDSDYWRDQVYGFPITVSTKFRTKLIGANLKHAKHVKGERLGEAIIDENTIFPYYLESLRADIIERSKSNSIER